MSITPKPDIAVPEIIAVSRSMRDVVRLVDTVAMSDCCVLIEGESGTGKELLARRLCLKSPRREMPFIPVNCAGVSDSLFESQFFGHVRGAFTGAEQNMLGLVRTAHEGTLFLDEIGEIPFNLQAKLLRVIQEQEVQPVGKPIPVKVDTRFIAGTNRNLREMVAEGTFRQDLYFRLNIVRVAIPPLRDRTEDVAPLIQHYAKYFAKLYKRTPLEISPEIQKVLTQYPWPGNVRELAALIERAYATGLDVVVLVEMLLNEAALPNSGSTKDRSDLNLEKVERRTIVQAMEQADHNQRKAANLLQVHRATLARKLKKHGLS